MSPNLALTACLFVIIMLIVSNHCAQKSIESMMNFTVPQLKASLPHSLMRIPNSQNGLDYTIASCHVQVSIL